MREVLGEFLRAYGYEAELASDTIEGLNRMAVRRPDVVLLDLRMPGVHGTTVISKICKEAPVIIITGDIDPNLQQKTLEDGAFAFAEKPFELAELGKLLVAAMEQ